MKIDLIKILACPNCENNLISDNSLLFCDGCNNKYRIEDGVVHFLKKADDFYEGAYARQIHYLPKRNPIKNWVFFNLVQSGVIGEIKNAIQPGMRVLDIGCGGGIIWLGKYVETIGLDLSISSLIIAKRCYSTVIQANMESLPFKEGVFDLIYGSYVFEHLTKKAKNEFIKKAYRALRPNGKIILQFDTQSNNWITRFAMQDKEAYEESFIKTDAHIGLEPLSSAISELESGGFKILRVLKFGTTIIQYQATYNWLNKAYGEKYFCVRWVAKIVNTILSKPPGIVLEFLITGFDKVINKFSKADAATRAILVAQKF